MSIVNLFTHQGHTGLSGPPDEREVLENEWDYPKKKRVGLENGYCYYVKGKYHCPFGPAIVYSNGTESWYIKGKKLSSNQVNKMKSILADIKLAPLFINHHIFKYSAKWVLKNHKLKKETRPKSIKISDSERK